MALDGIIAGEFEVYVAADDTAADFTGKPGSPWSLLGKGWNNKGTGITHRIAREFTDIMVENELEPIDARLNSVEQTLELMLLDWSPATLAWAIHGDGTSGKVTTVAAAAGVEGASTITLDLDKDPARLAIMVVGPSPFLVTAGNTGPNYMRVYWPSCRMDGDWETDFMLATAAPNPFRVKRLLPPSTSANVPQFHIQSTDAL